MVVTAFSEYWKPYLIVAAFRKYRCETWRTLLDNHARAEHDCDTIPICNQTINTSILYCLQNISSIYTPHNKVQIKYLFVAIYLDKIVHNSDHNVTIKCKRIEKELNATEHNYTNYEWIMTIPHASSQHSWCGSQLSTEIDNSCQPSSAARWRGGAGVPTINHINKNQNIWHNWFRYVRLARRIGTLLATSQWNISSVFVR